MVGYTSAGSLTFYVVTVYSKTYLTNIGALIFKDAGIENIFFIYVIFMLIICFLCSLALPKKPEYLEHDH